MANETRHRPETLPRRMADTGAGAYWAEEVAPRSTAATTVSRVAASATVVTLLASNSVRKGFSLYSEPGSAVLYVKRGAAATTTDYSFRLQPGEFYESPADPTYTGIVTGIWASATGAVQVETS